MISEQQIPPVEQETDLTVNVHNNSAYCHIIPSYLTHLLWVIQEVEDKSV